MRASPGSLIFRYRNLEGVSISSGSQQQQVLRTTPFDEVGGGSESIIDRIIRQKIPTVLCSSPIFVGLH